MLFQKNLVVSILRCSGWAEVTYLPLELNELKIHQVYKCTRPYLNDFVISHNFPSSDSFLQLDKSFIGHQECHLNYKALILLRVTKSLSCSLKSSTWYEYFKYSYNLRKALNEF